MAKPPNTDAIATEFTVPERVLLFCLAAGTDWVKAGVTAQQPDSMRRIGVLMGYDENDPEAKGWAASLNAAAITAILGVLARINAASTAIGCPVQRSKTRGVRVFAMEESGRLRSSSNQTQSQLNLFALNRMT
jgi:hypothetical protein